MISELIEKAALEGRGLYPFFWSISGGSLAEWDVMGVGKVLGSAGEFGSTGEIGSAGEMVLTPYL